MEPHTSKVLLGYARLNVPHGLWRLYNEPVDRTFFENPALTRVADDVQPLYITVDPERDTPEVLRTFLQEHYSRFIGLTGSREQIDHAKRAFRVFAQRRDKGGGNHVAPHTAVEPSRAGNARSWTNEEISAPGVDSESGSCI